MNTTGVQDRDMKAVEYLQSLRSLTHELERAMQAIGHNALSELEQSIDSQQMLSARLGELANDMCIPLEADSAIPMACLDEDLRHQNPLCLRRASDAESQVRGLAQAFQPFRCTDGVALQFVPRSISGGFWPQVEASDLVLPDVIAMGALNTSLLVGMQALEATQGALEATSNNIANANTPGYTREVVQFSENHETETNGQVSGGGVSLDGIQSIRDELLNLQIQQQTSLQSSVDTQSSALQQIQTNFSTSSGADIASALSAFSTSLAQLSANPSSSAVQQSALSAGQNLANAFNTTADALTSAQSYADGQVTQTVAQINSLTAQIAQLNWHSFRRATRLPTMAARLRTSGTNWCSSSRR